MTQPWTLEMGSQVMPQGVRFRVWAPRARAVDVALVAPGGERHHPLTRGPDGVWEGTVSGAGAGTRYRYRLDGGDAYPDPYSRFQPEGAHGPSEVVDPSAYPWSDQDWPGLEMQGLVVYECHVGTATPQGTFDALIGQLDRLVALGVTAIELMPVAEFPGRWNWGYDGVDLYAPYHGYGGPEGLRRLVDAAHQRGLGVLLDVVYNHVGPDGNYLRQYSPNYFTARYATPWGEAVNYDGPNSRWVRHLVIQNACYWTNEFHMDGLRLDATHAIFDASPRHILQELAEAVRASLPPGRRTVVIAETHENDVRYLLPPVRGGHGLDGVWADDFHHTVHVCLTGERDGYYQDFEGTATEIARTLRQGFLYEGQPSRFLGHPRGTPARDVPATGFVVCLQNHDQVGNRALGERLHHLTHLPQYRAALALLLLTPYTPLLFMGDEFAASSPFLYFTDHNPDLGRLVTEGRRAEFASFSAFSDPARRQAIPDPQGEETFRRSRLDLAEREAPRGAQTEALVRELLALRRGDPVLRRQDRRQMYAQAAGPRMVAVHLWHQEQHRLLLANLGDAATALVGQGALAKVPVRTDWRVALHTEAQRFGGDGQGPALKDGRIYMPRHCTAWLEAP